MFVHDLQCECGVHCTVTVILYCVFCNDTATTDIYTYLHTLSLHDALPIWIGRPAKLTSASEAGSSTSADVSATGKPRSVISSIRASATGLSADRKSTRLNSSH